MREFFRNWFTSECQHCHKQHDGTCDEEREYKEYVAIIKKARERAREKGTFTSDSVASAEEKISIFIRLYSPKEYWQYKAEEETKREAERVRMQDPEYRAEKESERKEEREKRNEERKVWYEENWVYAVCPQCGRLIFTLRGTPEEGRDSVEDCLSCHYGKGPAATHYSESHPNHYIPWARCEVCNQVYDSRGICTHELRQGAPFRRLEEKPSQTEEEKRRRYIIKQVRDAAFVRDGGKCVECGSRENLHIDHIIPHSRGGSDTLENLQILCAKCNLTKGNRSIG